MTKNKPSYAIKYLAISILIMFSVKIIAQNSEVNKPKFPLYNCGFGAGLDYGGIGGRLTILPVEELQLFGSVGYNFAGVGFNAGTSFRIITHKRIYPYCGIMYGYNAAMLVKIKNDTYNFISYGPSINIGLEWWLRRPRFLNLEIVVPFLSQNFQDDYQAIKKIPNIVFETKPRKFLISIGYHFVI